MTPTKTQLKNLYKKMDKNADKDSVRVFVSLVYKYAIDKNIPVLKEACARCFYHGNYVFAEEIINLL